MGCSLLVAVDWLLLFTFSIITVERALPTFAAISSSEYLQRFMHLSFPMQLQCTG
jgi:hypothetical protein